MTESLLTSMILEAGGPRDLLEELNQMIRLGSEPDVEEMMQLLFEAWDATPREELGDQTPAAVGGDVQMGPLEVILRDWMQQIVQQFIDQAEAEGFEADQIDVLIAEQESEFIHTPVELLGWHTPMEMIEDEREGLVTVVQEGENVQIDHSAPRPMAEIRARQPFDSEEPLLQSVDALICRYLEERYMPDEVHVARLIWGDYCTIHEPEIERPGVPVAALEYIVARLALNDVDLDAVARAYEFPEADVAAWFRKIVDSLDITLFDDRYPLAESPLRTLPEAEAERLRESVQISLTADALDQPSSDS
jgi:hypothetical protein